MGVKAREIVKKEAASFKQLVLIFVILLGFQYITITIQNNVSEQVSFIINVFFTTISLWILAFIIMKVLPRYELMIIENDFKIYKSLFLRPKLIYNIPLRSITDIKIDSEIGNIKGRKKNLTLFALKDKEIYVIEIKGESMKQYLYIQSSKKFIDKLDKFRKKSLN